MIDQDSDGLPTFTLELVIVRKEAINKHLIFFFKAGKFISGAVLTKTLVEDSNEFLKEGFDSGEAIVSAVAHWKYAIYSFV